VDIDTFWALIEPGKADEEPRLRLADALPPLVSATCIFVRDFPPQLAAPLLDVLSPIDGVADTRVASRQALSRLTLDLRR